MSNISSAKNIINNLNNNGPSNGAKMNGNSNIPKRSISRQSSSSSFTSKIPVNNPEAYKWRNKCEESEQKRKNLLSEKEKVLRSYNEVNKKYCDLQVKHECLETELFEKNEEYTKLTIASKNLYKEYETLKNQYETETVAMSRALKDASQWYKENKELKRRTLLVDKDTVDEGVDAGESNADSDLENLQKTIKQLSTEVAELQTEKHTLTLVEFQTSEQNSKLTEELELEKQKNKKLEHDFEELRKQYEQIVRVSEMMKKEMEGLQQIEETQRNSVVELKREADNYKKERNVLKHQSTLLMQNLNEENGNENMTLLMEIEDLKRTLEEERNKHEEEINALQEKIDEVEPNSHVEVLEERLKLVESELQAAIERAEKAEEALKAPPAPPPPPPPPLLPPQPPAVPLRVKRRSKVNVLDIAETIGVPEPPADGKKPAVGVNDDIINAIKEGKFTLKKAKNEGKKEKESTKAVSELLNILGSLRRAPKKRQSQYIGDVQL